MKSSQTLLRYRAVPVPGALPVCLLPVATATASTASGETLHFAGSNASTAALLGAGLVAAGPTLRRRATR